MSNIELFDLEPKTSDFLADVVQGLQASPKTIPPKYFYDERGSALFDQICELDEYYPTRTETAILDQFSDDINDALPEQCLLLEYGSGSSIKIHKILESSAKIKTYIPLDISKEHLLNAAEAIAASYPKLTVKAVCADYTEDKIKTLDPGVNDERVIFFPGSTIGNLNKGDARNLLDTAREFLRVGGLFILGIDLIKDRRTLLQAYNDQDGVTAEFNLNMLSRINRELKGDFELDQFRHEAIFNEDLGRIEMHLFSKVNQTVRIMDQSFHFRENESIHTENSQKFRVHDFLEFAGHSGFKERKIFTDEKETFAVLMLEAKAD
ncbi:L-histidine N(alpha)-methyltransferase [Pseudobacteriovorax antillogorgiicola]|uniref:Dimethylhistidine N-methyltransferase n=1 Tax=Pseudobacteriovorax antillogorgiicola TaxID=1513793 RepID=A0A1Y6BMS9_9BACT|nr:L-histidine N(alpha)-methyltransferase [Pseudobacteriovorax antillogorgiicola]TCS53933.1 dimethylhistidine N-methyltransferase [Pseudobacteriovorax antillogorgiicola]SMF20373.1 dimethylhistidine N-methyltransferase [Pseudobacteriovorax antillogorgiicola]